MTPSAPMPTVLNLISYAIYIIDAYLVPLVFALAFIMFLFGVYRGFIASNADPKKIAEGRQFVLWAIIGFAVMVSVWGLVRILVNTVPFGSLSRPSIPKFNEQSLQNSGAFRASPESQSGTQCRTSADCGGAACMAGRCISGPTP